jgi:Cu(I)-responsive transcriptional regulator
METGRRIPMNIGEVAKRAGVSAKSIRYYESVGLIAPAGRRGNNYRDYGERDVAELRFVNRARALGFSVKEVGDLLALWRDKKRGSGQVAELARRHMADIERKIAELETMRATLSALLASCPADRRPDCPILADIAGESRHGGVARESV